MSSEKRHRGTLGRMVIFFYLAVTALQLLWHGVFPAPLGGQNWPLAIIAVVPLILPLRGIVAGNLRSMTWGGYLLVAYFVIGVMEVWSDPAQRVPAALQIALTLLYVTCLVKLCRYPRLPG